MSEENSRLLGENSFRHGTVLELDSTAPTQQATPAWAWPLLAAALLAVSSAATAFALLSDVTPITLASWRLQLTGILLTVPAIPQYCSMTPDQRQKTLESTLLLVGSGTALALHFGFWVTSVQWTSLPHSLVFVAATPILLALLMWLRKEPISRGELFGTGLGLMGTVILASSAAAGAEEHATFLGDFAALAASASFVPYMLIGRKLRTWMTLFVYVAPVTALASLQLTLAAALAESSRLNACGSKGLFGWVCSRHHAPIVVYLAIVPGIIGHTGINTLLKHMAPLVIALFLNLEPLVGSIIGYAMGVSHAPAIMTYIGGFVVMAATAIVSIAAHQREQAEMRRVWEMQQIKSVMSPSRSDYFES